MPTSFSTFNPGDLIEDTHIEQYIAPIQNLEMGKPWYGVSTGASPNNIEVDLTPAASAYTSGMLVHFKANATTTGPATLNVNGLGTKPIVKGGSSALVGGDILSGQMVAAIYDGASFQLLSPVLLPATAAPAPVKNKLVYSEVAKTQTLGSAVILPLPTFTFDPLKSYLLEVSVMGASGHIDSGGRVVFTAGSTTYSYPSATTYARARFGQQAGTARKLLPSLSGLHTIDVTSFRNGHVAVSLYELHDNLVYADFSSELSTSLTVETFQLASFLAVSGRRYEMTVTAIPVTAAIPSIACYLTNGSSYHGIPYSSPTTDFVDGPSGAGPWQMTKVLEGLNGSYDIFARGKYCNGVNIEIRDIT